MVWERADVGVLRRSQCHDGTVLYRRANVVGQRGQRLVTVEDSRSRPLVAAVIPTRRRDDRLLRRAVQSALELRGCEVEVIVVDDASEVPNPTALRSPVDDPRVRVIRSGLRPRAPAGARDLGLANVRSEFVIFLDDDDALDPGIVQRSLGAIKASELPPPVVVLHALEVADEAGQVVETRLPISTRRGQQYQFARAPGRSRICHASLFAPAELLRSSGGFDERIRSSEHGDLFFRLSDVASIAAVDEIGYRALEHGGPRNSSNHLARARAEVLGMSIHACRPGFTGRRRSWHLRKAARLAWQGRAFPLAAAALATSPVALVSCRATRRLCRMATVL